MWSRRSRSRPRFRKGWETYAWSHWSQPSVVVAAASRCWKPASLVTGGSRRWWWWSSLSMVRLDYESACCQPTPKYFLMPNRGYALLGRYSLLQHRGTNRKWQEKWLLAPSIFVQRCSLEEDEKALKMGKITHWVLFNIVFSFSRFTAFFNASIFSLENNFVFESNNKIWLVV